MRRTCREAIADVTEFSAEERGFLALRRCTFSLQDTQSLIPQLKRTPSTSKNVHKFVSFPPLEVIDRAYKVKLNSGGPVKPLEYLELAKQIQTMSEEEKENLQYMLNQLLNKAKDKK